MSYTFRVRFRVGSSRIQSDDAVIFLADAFADGEDIQIRVVGDGVIKDADMLAIWGEGYPTQAAANEAGERWTRRTQLALARLGIGADFGERRPGGGASDYLRQQAAAAGIQLINDEPGVLVFEPNPPPRFVSVAARGQVGKPVDRFMRAIREADLKDLGLSDQESVAFNLYAASFFQDDTDARFMLLMMALETLIVPELRDPETLEHLEKLIEQTANSELVPSQKNPLIRGLENLRTESIGSAGRRLAAALGHRTYMNMDQIDFFTYCYDLRGDLVHGADPLPSRNDVDLAAAHLEVFVGHLIGRDLLDQALDF
ncbi:MAG TPA: hypothetical protein VHO01_15230 [Jatrophihabitans sp.]|nr:hypothetical protein [Jatrophihabitans sp.]